MTDLKKLSQALAAYQQGDAEGIMCLVSRQAVEELLDMIRSGTVVETGWRPLVAGKFYKTRSGEPDVPICQECGSLGDECCFNAFTDLATGKCLKHSPQETD
jgi:hypothetical protein